MKSLAISIVLALAASAPALAQEGPNPPAEPAYTGVIDEDMILEATTLEDRAALLRRCAGPPPRPFPVASSPTRTPLSEPGAVAETADRGANRGG